MSKTTQKNTVNRDFIHLPGKLLVRRTEVIFVHEGQLRLNGGHLILLNREEAAEVMRQLAETPLSKLARAAA